MGRPSRQTAGAERDTKVDVLVVGGGPAGLGAARQLEQAGADWRLLEADDHFGGLSASFVDGQGFTWDLGGHVLFSHYASFDDCMDQALGPDGWVQHQRESWVWIRNRFVPYPFQNNLHRLDPQDRWECVAGLLDARQRAARATDFDAWVEQTMGPGIARLFLRPYNAKVWAYPLTMLGCEWVGERVSVPDLRVVLKSICTGEDNVEWGPNRQFRFPRRGGTGAIWQALGRNLPPERVGLGQRVVALDARARVARTADGRQWHYGDLISTLPLDHLIGMTPGVVDPSIAGKLLYSSTHVVGLGLRGRIPEALATKCWMYFPESNSPYYRVTVFSNYSPHNVPHPGEQWSLMAEVAESPLRPVDVATVVERTRVALREDGLLPDDADIVSTVHRRLPHGYPTPFVGRDALVDPVLRAFEACRVFSRGRFGAWKYEVSNQDHSFAQGRECAARLLGSGGAACEPTLFTPGAVNSRRNP